VVGAFYALGAGSYESEIFGGLRARYQRPGSGVKLLLEAGFHDISPVDRGFFSTQDIPGAVLPFGGVRADWTPLQGRLISPLFSFSARADLVRRRTSGTYTEGNFFGPDTVEQRAYDLGGFTLALMGGVSFDFGPHAP